MDLIETLFKQYRTSGFPNYRKEDYSAKRELRRIHSADEYAYFDGKVFGKYQSSNGFLFSYFPHWIDVRCGGFPSLRECWEDDDRLRSLLKKTLIYCEKHGENWSTNRLRQNAKVYCASQSVSNFNPVCARILYDRFAPGGIVYDMSMGWGGRFLGYCASSARLYLGCEPSTKTFAGLRELHKDLGGKVCEMWCIGSENVDLSAYTESVDFAFTSPPYFDTEKYSDESTQSYIAYPMLDEWLEKFLFRTFEKCYYALRGNGVLAVNYSSDRYVCSAIMTMCESLGFRYEGEYKYELSSISGKGAKYEPIFVFRKEGNGPRRSLDIETLF